MYISINSSNNTSPASLDRHMYQQATASSMAGSMYSVDLKQNTHQYTARNTAVTT